MKRFVVYTLLDGSGSPLYIGMTSDLHQRIKGHYSDCHRDTWYGAAKRSWFLRSRSVSLLGPFSDEKEARRVERDEIKRVKPEGNVRWVREERLTTEQILERVRAYEESKLAVSS